MLFRSLTLITGSRALVSDANGLPVAATTTATEIGYVNGVTSAIQTQFTGKRAAFANGQLPGTATNDSASAGNVGEYIESIAGFAVFTSSGAWKDFTSISLTAGDWDVTGILVETSAGNASSDIELIVSSTAGNFSTGGVTGSNWVYGKGASPGLDNNTLVIPAYRVSLSGTTTYYLKGIATYAATAPQAGGRLSARRMR